MVTQKAKYQDRIKALRAKNHSVAEISKKLKINRGVVDSVLYPPGKRIKKAAKKVGKVAKKLKTKKTSRKKAA